MQMGIWFVDGELALLIVLHKHRPTKDYVKDNGKCKVDLEFQHE
jgi:hypothetical protein